MMIMKLGQSGSTMCIPLFSSSYTTNNNTSFLFMVTTPINAPFSRIPQGAILHFQVQQ